MTSQQLSALLEQEISARGWVINDLAKAAGVAYESARRAVRGDYGITLESTNKLLGAVGQSIISTPTLSTPTPKATL